MTKIELRHQHGEFILEVDGQRVQGVVGYSVGCNSPGELPRLKVDLLAEEIDVEVDGDVQYFRAYNPHPIHEMTIVEIVDAANETKSAELLEDWLAAEKRQGDKARSNVLALLRHRLTEVGDECRSG